MKMATHTKKSLASKTKITRWYSCYGPTRTSKKCLLGCDLERVSKPGQGTVQFNSSMLCLTKNKLQHLQLSCEVMCNWLHHRVPAQCGTPAVPMHNIGALRLTAMVTGFGRQVWGKIEHLAWASNLAWRFHLLALTIFTSAAYNLRGLIASRLVKIVLSGLQLS
jgi:hypothetical protein